MVRDGNYRVAATQSPRRRSRGVSRSSSYPATISGTGYASDLHGWFKVTVDGSGNVAFFYSRDGAFWKALGTTTLAAYLEVAGGTFDEIGVFVRANGSGLTSGAVFHYYNES